MLDSPLASEMIASQIDYPLVSFRNCAKKLVCAGPQSNLTRSSTAFQASLFWPVPYLAIAV